jgi:ATP-binding cassette subfamily C protein
VSPKSRPEPPRPAARAFRPPGDVTPKRWRKRLGKWAGAIREVMALAPRRQRALVVVGTFVSSVLDLIGLTMMVPLIIAATDLQESTKGIVVALSAILKVVGLPFAPLPILSVIVVGLGLKAVVGIFVTRFVDQVVTKVTRDMRIRLIRSLLGARWGYFVRQSVGRLAFAIGPEADSAGQCFLVLTNLLACCLQILLFVLILAVFSWQLLLIAIVITVVAILWFGGLVRSTRQDAKERRQEARRRSAKFTDTLTGIKPIRAMGRADGFAELFADEARLLAKRSRARIFGPEYATDLQEPIIGAVLAIGFYLAITRLHLEVHDLLIMSILMVKTIAALMPMQRLAQRFIQSYDHYRSLNRLLDVSEHAREIWPGRGTPTLEREIAFDHVAFAYRARGVLDGLNLRIPAGAITALIGVSGVGKSTIADLVVGLYQPTGGVIRVDGTDLRYLDIRLWRQDVGYSPQEVLLFHDTVRNNVTLYEEGFSDEAVLAALAAAGAGDFIAESPQGLDTVVGERGSRLSGGQRQRISIARALLHRPRLLILDEATTGLDQEAEWAICTHIRRLCENTGLTVLAVSHQPAWQQAAHHLYRIEAGAAVPMTPPSRRLPDLAGSAA